MHIELIQASSSEGVCVNHYLREFVLTTVILTPAREVGRVVIAVLHRFRKIAGPTGQIPRGSFGFTIIMVLALLSRNMGPEIQIYLTFKAIFT